MKLMMAAALSALVMLACNSQALAAQNDEQSLPLDVENVTIEVVGVMPTGFPDRATGIDAPVDMSVGNTTAMSMVNSGQVSPAAGAAGGFLGALVVAAIDAGVDANRNGKIEQMLEGQSFDAPAVFEAALLEALEAGNISAVYQKDVVRPEKKKFFNVVPAPDTKLDASVDVIIYQYGFTLDGLGWRPSVSAQVQLHDPATGEMLMNEFVTYGRTSIIPPTSITPGSYKAAPGAMASSVPFDQSNSFTSVDDYAKNRPERAVATLTEALQATARTIAGLITVAAAPAETEVASAEPSAQSDTAAPISTEH